MPRWLRGRTSLPLLTLLPVLAAGCGDCPGAPERTAATAAKPTKDAAPKSAAQKVVIDNFRYSPRELTVPIGTKVTWINRDDVPHTATSTAKPKAFDSGALDTDQEFSFTFTAPGTYEYFCAVHPKMTAQIIVK